MAGEAVVQESWLFRDREAFAALSRMAQAHVKDKHEPFRVLSVPCAQGEEPASAAAALLHAGLEPRRFVVDAADASPAALEAARSGLFGPASVRGPAADAPSGCPADPAAQALAGAWTFFQATDQGLRLAPQALERITFIEADATSPAFLAGHSPYHAILCRNLLIYLLPEARERLARNLERLLAPGGTLFASPAEAGAFAALGLSPWSACALRSAPKAARPKAPGTSRAAARPKAAAPGRRTPAAPPVSSSGPDAGPDSVPAPTLDEARALADQGRLEEALQAIEAHLALCGPSAEPHYLQGVAQLARGRAREAEQALRKALYLDPAHAGALTHLALLRQAQGRADEAALLTGRAARAGEERP
nr:CheR family methyltransferase [Fundidesulfovibrio soli]